jgi:hypothetical protein
MKYKYNPREAVVTTSYVMKERSLIVYAEHAEDGWQFISKEGADMTKTMLVALEEIIEIDKTVDEIKNIGWGYFAERRNKDEPWRISKIIEEEEE